VLVFPVSTYLLIVKRLTFYETTLGWIHTHTVFKDNVLFLHQLNCCTVKPETRHLVVQKWQNKSNDFYGLLWRGFF